MKKTIYPEGLLQLKISGMPVPAEYKGINKATCLVCGRECDCHTFNVIMDVENYPDYKNFTVFHLGEDHAKTHVQVVGKSVLTEA
jgi:transcription elongation factor Elf1